MDEKKEKRVLNIELDENVKKVSITGLGDDETVVMKQELTEEELDQATGGGGTSRPYGEQNQSTGITKNPYCQGDICTEHKMACRPYYWH